MFDDKKLKKAMRDLKSNQSDSLELIYDMTHRLIYFQIYKIIKRKDIAEDILQDVYMKVIDKIHLYHDDYPKAWLLSIARNEALNYYNKHKKESLIDVEQIKAVSLPDTETPIIDLASNILDEDEFMILMSCIIDDKPRRVVAKDLNLSISGVTYKLNIALEKMKTHLEGGK